MEIINSLARNWPTLKTRTILILNIYNSTWEYTTVYIFSATLLETVYCLILAASSSLELKRLVLIYRESVCLHQNTYTHILRPYKDLTDPPVKYTPDTNVWKKHLVTLQGIFQLEVLLYEKVIFRLVSQCFTAADVCLLISQFDIWFKVSFLFSTD